MKRRTHATWAVRAALVLCVLVEYCSAHAQQGLNNLWMGGWQSWADPPFGGVDLQFLSGTLEITTVARSIDFNRTSSNITSTEGELLFSTNGAFVAHALGDTMANGSGLNPSWYTSQYPDGLLIPQGVLIIPKPEDPDLHYLFHVPIDVWATTSPLQLYYTVIDMSLEGGLGAVVAKNQVLIQDELNGGKLTAVRHANGRDWWVYTHKLNTNIFHRILVTPEGIQVDGTQAIGPGHPPDAGQVCFSPDGTLFAYFYENFEVFPIDRCTGMFSEPIIATTNQFDYGRGVAFSPNGRFLYLSTTMDVYQFDMEAPSIADSEVHIAHWDSTYSPFPPFAALFDNMQLAPDGKIYIGTGTGTQVLHVIHNPDEPGLACNLEQHGIDLPRYFMNSLPNHPNYHLGPLAGSPCDTLGLAVAPLSLGEGLGVRAYPNPSNGQFNLSYPVHPDAGLLEVLDLQGRVVYQSRLAAWSQVHNVSLQSEAAGMYQCRFVWGARRVTTRIVIE
ncbi:MAG: T9SS type A sorting domain-containing protein [Flavobacteriales bacterium]|jgi:hypothetical protein|nr:T9SS type A sorting domain-containing protein [Flavobacteriales bacterium]